MMEKPDDSHRKIILPRYITEPFMSPIKDDGNGNKERIKKIKNLLLELNDERYADFISHLIIEMMIQLQKFHEEKSRTIKEIPGPIFSYDDRYFLECNYTKDELYILQNQILSIIKKGSSDIMKEVKKQTSISDKEINTCLVQSFHYRLIDRARIVNNDSSRFFRYFTK